MKDDKMRMVGIGMSIRMGIAMSFVLSLTGTLSSGHFSLASFLMSFVVSTVISLLIGFLIPVGQITKAATRAAHLEEGTLAARCLETLICDLIYTPIMTFLMVFMAYQMVIKQSNGMVQLNLLQMYLPSLGLCFVVGYILIFFIQPFFLKQLLKKYENGTDSTEQ